MTPHFLSLLAFVTLPLALAHHNASTTCKDLESTLSPASSVYYNGSAEYDAGIEHWANSSSQAAACVVQPGSASDVGKILQVVGQYRTPFAIKGGGHATNQGFSSTTGVHIAMSRFNQIDYDARSQSVTVGTGLVWDQIYAALDPHNVTVVGGRVSGVGIAGFTLGGGYSYLSNMYGLASDNVLQYELVLPSGKVVHVDATSHPDLFFGLRGGFNNLGVVTKFTLKTHPLGQVWGGSVFVSPEYAADVFAATAKFQSTNKDPKAAMIMGPISLLMPAFGSTPVPLINLLLFYAACTPAPGVFDDFLTIPTLAVQGSGLPFGTTNYSTLIAGGNVGPNFSIGPRAVFNTYGFTNYSLEFLNAVLGETISSGQNLLNDSLVFINVAIEPFLDSALSHSATPSLYPASRKQVYLPTNLYLSWVDPAMDQVMHNAARDIIGRLKATAVSLGEDFGDGGLYPNYAIAGNGTSVEDFWGKEHVARLRVLRKVYDSSNVMGLTGGWRV